jgi:hypothetical protein
MLRFDSIVLEVEATKITHGWTSAASADAYPAGDAIISGNVEPEPITDKAFQTYTEEDGRKDDKEDVKECDKEDDKKDDKEDDSVERACPFHAQEGRMVVESPEDAVLTTRSQSENSSGLLEVDIPAGTYSITLVSYEDHIEQPQEEDQPQESWFLQAHNAEGDFVFFSNPISDLPLEASPDR